MSDRDAGRGTWDADADFDDQSLSGSALLEEEAVPYQVVRNFEDLTAWQRARDLTSDIYALTRTGEFRTDFGLRDQVRRAAVSVMSNIAEGNERGSAQEYFRFLTIAKASCADVRSLLYVARDAGYIDDATFLRHMDSARRVAQLVGTLRTSIGRRIADQRR